MSELSIEPELFFPEERSMLQLAIASGRSRARRTDIFVSLDIFISYIRQIGPKMPHSMTKSRGLFPGGYARGYAAKSTGLCNAG